jgi:hypothetical protein
MNDSYMKGTWTGTYKYQLKSHPELNKGETGFVLTITEFDGVNFKGIVIDDLETGGTKGEGTIDGTFDNGIINFVKQMPVLTMGIRNKGTKEFPVKHKPIYYTGTLNSENLFVGEWKMKGGITFNKYVIALSLNGKGTWKMSKKNDNV